jgi:hypothetical protein
MMALLRYGHGMPWNRLAALQESLGIPLPAMTQWDLLRQAAERLLLVYEHLILQAAQGKVVYNDDTHMRVLELMDEKSRGQALRDDDPQRRGIFTTGIVSVGEGHSLALFFTGPRHAGENLREVLLRRAQGLPPPTQMCDADPLDYLTHLLRSHQQAVQAPQEWMPWNYQAAAGSAPTEPTNCRRSPPVAPSQKGPLPLTPPLFPDSHDFLGPTQACRKDTVIRTTDRQRRRHAAA